MRESEDLWSKGLNKAKILLSGKGTVKPVLETICIKRPPTLRDHCSVTTTPLKSTKLNLHLKTTCCKRPLLLLPLGGLNTGYTV